MPANPANITLRTTKGLPLTYAELDANFQEMINLVNDVQAYDVLNNESATTDPTVTDDTNAGYEVRSMWINTSSGEIFRCIDSTAGAAIWVKTTLTIDELGNAATYNVGAGNGLDADLLDGRQGQEYVDESLALAIALG